MGAFDDRTRLAPASSALFNRPAHPGSEALFRTLADNADAHLGWVVRRAVATYLRGEGDVPPLSGTSFPAPPLPGSVPLSAVGEEWAATLLRLARRATAVVDPNVRAGDRLDIRWYVQVKAIPEQLMTGSPPTRVGGCELVNGVMFRKSLPHKAMRTEILPPRAPAG